MDKLLEQVQAFFTEKPEYIYLLLAVVFGIMVLGTIRNKNWAVDPANSNQRFLYSVIGRRGFRVVYIIVFTLGFLAGLYGFYYYSTH